MLGALLIAGCRQDFSPLGPLFDLGPVTVVHVNAPTSMHVGDSTRVSAFGYNKVGYLTRLTSARVWTVSDMTAASIRPLTPQGDSARVTARRAGSFRVVATVEQVSGSVDIMVAP